MGVLGELFHKHFWKAFFVLLAFVLISLSIAFVTDYYSKKSAFDEAKRAERMQEEMMQKYNADTYGGKTPEETLALFIAALKKGDTDLASKYFIIDKQAEWKKNLEKIKAAGHLSSMVVDLSGHKTNYSITNSRIVFDFTNIKKQVIASVDIAKGANGVWKIVNL